MNSVTFSNRLYKRYFILLALMCFPMLVKPFTVNQSKYRHLSVKEGLSHNMVNSVIQDSTGLIWFATRNGIDSYDGSQFKHYNLVSDNPNFIENLFARIAIVDSEKNIWVGTTKGLFKYNRIVDAFERVTFTNHTGINNTSIFSIYSENKGVLWAGTSSAIFRLDLSKKTAVKLENFEFPVLNIYKLNPETILFSTKNKILTYSCSDSLVQEITQDISKKIIPNDTVNLNYSVFIPDNSNKVWISTIDKGLHLFDSSLNLVKSLSTLNVLGKKPFHIGNIIHKGTGNYTLSVFGYGIIRVDDKFNILESSTVDDDNKESLKSDNISDLMYDINGRLWVTTQGAGISVHDPNMLSYTTFVHEKNRDESLGNNTGRAVLEDPQGNIWFGTKRGISIYSTTSKTWRHFYNEPGEKEIFYTNNINSLCQINPDEIWISCFGGGICVYKLSTDKFYKLHDLYPIKGIDLSIVSNIFVDSKKNIWLGRYRESSLIKLAPNTFQATEYPMTNISTIFESSNQKMYVSNNYRLWTIDTETDLITMDEIGQSGTQEIRFINSLNEYSDSLIIIGTDGNGIYFFNRESMKIENLSTKEGLASNNISSIIVHNDKLWISSILGVTNYNLKDKTISNYTIDNGLNISSFSPNNAILTSDNELIFGGEEGYIKMNPEFFSPKNTNPTLRFTHFSVNKIKTPIGSKDSPLDKNINLTEEIVLKYNQNSFDFEFSSINFTNPTQDRFSWKLDNFDGDWSEISQNKLASYTNIPQGSYTFNLKLVTPDGIADTKQISITVQPPWWISPWALLVYLLFLIGLIFMLHFINNVRFKAKQSKDKISFFIDLAHELRTPLTLIQSPLSKLLKNNYLAEQDVKYLDMAIKNATKINKYFNQLLDFQKVDMKRMKINYTKSDIVSHVQEICKNFSPLIAEKNIQFNIYSKEQSIEFYYDPDIIEKIIYNLMSNAIKYCSANGEISIRMKIVKNNCIIKVSDNGIGIPTNQQKNIFKRYFRASNSIQSQISGIGVGLMLVKQLVDLIDGKITFTSSEGVGTIFTLGLKIINSPINIKNNEAIVQEYLPIFQTEKTVENGTDLEMEEEWTADINRKHPKILIAEDNAELREFLFDSFKDEYNVITCDNGAKALDISKRYDILAIISDIMMPIMDGRVLCKEIKTNIETCHIPVILLTALSDKDYRIEGYEAGADGYIEKPFDINVLKSRIENLIQSRKILKSKFIKHDDSIDNVDFQNNIDSDFIKKAYDLIEQNLNNTDFNIDVFSKEMLVSRSILYRKIKALTDLSPLEFITLSRLKHSVRLLKSGQYSIKEISYMCGFSDPRYFSTTFKKHFNTTPSAYTTNV